MIAPIILALRLLLAIALFGFLGWAFFFLLRDIQNQGYALAGRRVPGIRISIHNRHGAPLVLNFSKPEITIGRDPGCDIPLIDDTVSIRHAHLVYHHGQWWLGDLTSTNGTVLNNMNINTPTVLTSGDEIKCGATQLLVNLSTDALLAPTQRLEKKRND